MGAAAGPVAAVSSITSIGFGLMGSEDKAQALEMQGQGENAADQFKASQAEEAAKFGRLQAGLTDTTMREQLNMTLANIDAIRASNGVDIASPTTGAIEDRNRLLSDRQRISAGVTLRSQAATDEASAAYLRQAGTFAMAQASKGASAQRLAGYAQAAGSIAKGLPGLA